MPVLLPDQPLRSLDEYRAWGGGGALTRARELGPDAVVEAITAAGLRGRGGAGFPAGTKWSSIREGGPEVGERYVVANGAEGEPGTFKDRMLMRRNPYQVLEGVAVAAQVVGAVHAFVAVKRSFEPETAALSRALAEMSESGMLGDVPISLVGGPDEYLFGEEKGLLEVIEGEDPLPRMFPPFVYGLFTTSPQMGWSAGVEVPVGPGGSEEGVARSNPTLVNNVETLANVPVVLRDGPESYRSRGTDRSPGSVIVTVVGDVARAGVAEVDLGTPLREVLDRVGGGLRPGRRVKAVLPGAANPVVTADHLDVPLTYEGLEAAGSGMGAAGFVVYDDTTDMVAVARAFSRFLYVESCGQCPACKFGTGEVTAYLDRILAGRGTDHDVEVIGARLVTVTDANRCYLPVQEQRLIGSLLRAFPEDFAAHLEGRAPSAEARIPKIVDLLDDGTAVWDERQATKRPDWTYEEGSPGGSGGWPG